MRIAALLAGALLAGAAALAQAPDLAAPDLAAPDLPRRYEVEIIVFANREFDPTEELFDHAPEGFDFTETASLREVPIFDETTFAPPAPEPVLPVDPVEALRAEALKTRVLAPEELKLGNEYRRLAASRPYTPLVHAGWVLPGLPEEDAMPFDLGTLGVLNVSGTVKVHLSRFLHITLDLTYQASAGNTPAPASADGLDEIVVGQKYRLRATRSARSGELHYFDHPAFGALVRIRPVDEPGDSGRPAA